MPWLKSKLPIFAVLASVGAACVMFGRTTSAVTPAALMVSPRFEPAPCPFTPAADQVEGLTVSCGFVLVPENRSRSEGNWIRLAVAIFKSPTIATRPPLIFLGGGPGTFVLERFGPLVSGALTPDLTADRHLVMFDQRGVGFSQPSLGCHELVDLKYQTLGIRLTRDQETEAVVDAAFACRDRLVASGIELAAYTTGASAADVNDIRIALGYGPFDVWGLSYGTASPSRWSGISRRLFTAWCLIRRCLHR